MRWTPSSSRTGTQSAQVSSGVDVLPLRVAKATVLPAGCVPSQRSSPQLAPVVASFTSDV